MSNGVEFSDEKSLADIYVFEQKLENIRTGTLEKKTCTVVSKCVSNVAREAIKDKIGDLLRDRKVKENTKVVISEVEDSFDISYETEDGNTVQVKRTLEEILGETNDNNLIIKTVCSLTLEKNSNAEVKVYSRGKQGIEVKVNEYLVSQFTKKELAVLDRVFVVSDLNNINLICYNKDGIESYTKVYDESQVVIPENRALLVKKQDIYISDNSVIPLFIKNLGPEPKMTVVIKEVILSVFAGIAAFFMSIAKFLSNLIEITPCKAFDRSQPFPEMSHTESVESFKVALKDVTEVGSSTHSFNATLEHLRIMRSLVSENQTNASMKEIDDILKQSILIGLSIKEYLSFTNPSKAEYFATSLQHQLYEVMEKSLSRDAKLLIPLPVMQGRDAYPSFLYFTQREGKRICQVITLPANITGEFSKEFACRTYDLTRCKDAYNMSLAIMGILPKETELSKAEEGFGVSQRRAYHLESIISQFGTLIDEEYRMKGSSDPVKALLTVVKAVDKTLSNELTNPIWKSKATFYTAYVNKMIEGFDASSARLTKNEKLKALKAIKFYANHTKLILEKSIGIYESNIVVGEILKQINLRLELLEEPNKEKSNIEMLNRAKVNDCSFEIKGIKGGTTVIPVVVKESSQAKQLTVSAKQIISISSEIQTKLYRLQDLDKEHLSVAESVEIIALFPELLSHVQDLCKKNDYINAEYILRILIDEIPLPSCPFWNKLSVEELDIWTTITKDISETMYSLKLQQGNKLWLVSETVTFFSEIKILQSFLYKLKIKAKTAELNKILKTRSEDVGFGKKQEAIAASVKKILQSVVVGAAATLLVKDTKIDETINKYENSKGEHTAKIRKQVDVADKVIEDIIKEELNKENLVSLDFFKRLSKGAFLEKYFKQFKEMPEEVLERINDAVFGVVCKELDIDIDTVSYIRTLHNPLELMCKRPVTGSKVGMHDLLNIYDKLSLVGLDVKCEKRNREYASLLRVMLPDLKEETKVKREKKPDDIEFVYAKSSLTERTEGFILGYASDIQKTKMKDIFMFFDKSEIKEEARKRLVKILQTKAKDLKIKTKSSMEALKALEKGGIETGDVLLDKFSPKESYISAEHYIKCFSLGYCVTSQELLYEDKKNRSLDGFKVFKDQGLLRTAFSYDEKQQPVMKIIADGGGTSKLRDGSYSITQLPLNIAHPLFRQDTKVTSIKGVNRSVSEQGWLINSFDLQHFISLTELEMFDLLSAGDYVSGAGSEGAERQVSDLGLLLGMMHSGVKDSLTGQASSTENYKNVIALMSGWPHELVKPGMQDFVRINLLNQGVISGQNDNNHQEIKNGILVINDIVKAMTKNTKNAEHVKIALFCIEIMHRIAILSQREGFDDQEIDDIIRSSKSLAVQLFRDNLQDVDIVEMSANLINIFSQCNTVDLSEGAEELLIALYFVQTSGIRCSDIAAHAESKTKIQKLILPKLLQEMNNNESFRSRVCFSLSGIKGGQTWIQGDEQGEYYVDISGVIREVNVLTGKGFDLNSFSPDYKSLPKFIVCGADYRMLFGELQPMVTTKYYENNVIDYSWKDESTGVDNIIRYDNASGEAQFLQLVNGSLYKFSRIDIEESLFTFVKRMVFSITAKNERVEELLKDRGVWIKVITKENKELALDFNDVRIATDGVDITAPNIIKLQLNDKGSLVTKVFVGTDVKTGKIFGGGAQETLLKCCSSNRLIPIKDSQGNIIEYILPSGTSNCMEGMSLCRSEANGKDWVIKGKEHFILDNDDSNHLESLFGKHYEEYVLRFVNRVTGSEEFLVFPYNFVSETHKKGSDVKFIKTLMQEMGLRGNTHRVAAVLLSQNGGTSFGSIDAMQSFPQIGNIAHLKQCVENMNKIKVAISGESEEKKDVDKGQNKQSEEEQVEDLSSDSLFNDYKNYSSSMNTLISIQGAKDSNEVTTILIKHVLCLLETGQNIKQPLMLLKNDFTVQSKELLKGYKILNQREFIDKDKSSDFFESMMMVSVVLDAIDSLISMQDQQETGEQKTELELADLRNSLFEILKNSNSSFNKAVKVLEGKAPKQVSLKERKQTILEMLQLNASSEFDIKDNKQLFLDILEALETVLLSANGQAVDNVAPMRILKEGSTIVTSVPSWLYLSSIEGVKKNWPRATFYLQQAETNVKVDDLVGVDNVINSFMNNYEDLTAVLSSLSGIENRSAAEVAYMLKYSLFLLRLQDRVKLEKNFDIFEKTGLNKILLENKIRILFKSYKLNLSENLRYFIDCKLDLTQMEIDQSNSIAEAIVPAAFIEVDDDFIVKTSMQILDNHIQSSENSDMLGVNVYNVMEIPVPSKERVKHLFNNMKSQAEHKPVKSIEEFKLKYGTALSEHNVVSHFWELWNIIYSANVLNEYDLSFLWSHHISVGNGNVADIQTARQLLLLLFHFQRSDKFNDQRACAHPVMEALFKSINGYNTKMYNNANLPIEMDAIAANLLNKSGKGSKFVFFIKALKMIFTKALNQKSKTVKFASKCYDRSKVSDKLAVSVGLAEVLLQAYDSISPVSEVKSVLNLGDINQAADEAFENTGKIIDPSEKKILRKEGDVLYGPEGFDSLVKTLEGSTVKDRVLSDMMDVFGLKIKDTLAVPAKHDKGLETYTKSQIKMWKSFCNQVSQIIAKEKLELLIFGEGLVSESLVDDKILMHKFVMELVELKDPVVIQNNLMSKIWPGIVNRLNSNNDVQATCLDNLKKEVRDVCKSVVSNYTETEFDFKKTVRKEKQRKVISKFRAILIPDIGASLEVGNYIKQSSSNVESELLDRKEYAKIVLNDTASVREQVSVDAVNSGLDLVFEQLTDGSKEIVAVDKLKLLLTDLKNNIKDLKAEEEEYKAQLMSVLYSYSDSLGFNAQLLLDDNFKGEGLAYLLDLYANGLFGDVLYKDNLDLQVTKFLLIAIQRQQLEKAFDIGLAMLKDVKVVVSGFHKDSKIQSLESSQGWRLQSAELLDFIKKGSDVTRYCDEKRALKEQPFTRKYLVNEYQMGWIIRTKTAEGLERLLGDVKSDPQEVSRFEKVIMGAGKTTCLLPIAVQTLASEGKKPVLVTTSALLAQTKAIFGSKAFQFKFKVPFVKNKKQAKEAIENLKFTNSLLTKLYAEGNFVITSPEYLSALKNARALYSEELFNSLSKTQVEEVDSRQLYIIMDELRSIENFFKDPDTVFLQDEDVNLSISQEYNLAVGDPKRCDLVRVSVVERINYLMLTKQDLSKYADMLTNSDFRSLLDEDLKDGSLTTIGAKTDIAKVLYKDSKYWESLGVVGGVSSILSEQDFVAFVTEAEIGLVDDLINKIKTNVKFMEHLAATKSFLTKTFDSVKNTRAHLDRGIKSSNGVSVVPYSDGLEKPNMMYGEDYEIVVHTFAHYAHIKPGIQQKAFYRHFNKYKNSEEIIPGSLGELTWRDWAKSIISEKDMSNYESVYDALEKSPVLALHRVLLCGHFLRETDFTTLHGEQITCNSQDVTLGCDTRVVSGTGDRYEIVSGDKSQCELQEDIDISMAETMLKADISKTAETFTMSPLDYISNIVKDPNCVAIVNCDYDVFQNNSAMLVSHLRKNPETANRQYVYRNTKLEKVIQNPGATSTPNAYTVAGMNPSACVIYSPVDTRGVDIKIPRSKDNYGVVMVGLKNSIDTILQAVWRMRALGMGQELKFAFDAKTEKDIRAVCEIHKDAIITSTDVLKYGLRVSVSRRDLTRLKVAAFKVTKNRKLAVDKIIRSKHRDCVVSKLERDVLSAYMEMDSLFFNELGRELVFKQNVTKWDEELENKTEVEITQCLVDKMKAEEKAILKSLDLLDSKISVDLTNIVVGGNLQNLAKENCDEFRKLMGFLSKESLRCKGLKTEQEIEQEMNHIAVKYCGVIDCSIIGWHKAESILAKNVIRKFSASYKELFKALVNVRKELAEIQTPEMKQFLREYHSEFVKSGVGEATGSEVEVQTEVQAEEMVEQEQEQEAQAELNMLQMRSVTDLPLANFNMTTEKTDERFKQLLLQDVNDCLCLGQVDSKENLSLVNSEKIQGIDFIQTADRALVGAVFVDHENGLKDEILQEIVLSGGALNQIKNYYRIGCTKMLFAVVVKDLVNKTQKFVVTSGADVTSLEKEINDFETNGDKSRFSYDVYSFSNIGKDIETDCLRPILNSSNSKDKGIVDLKSPEGEHLTMLFAYVKAFSNDVNLSYAEIKALYEAVGRFENHDRYNYLESTQLSFEKSMENSPLIYKSNLLTFLRCGSFDETTIQYKEYYKTWFLIIEKALFENHEFFSNTQQRLLLNKFKDQEGEAYFKALKSYIRTESKLTEAGKKQALDRIEDLYKKVVK